MTISRCRFKTIMAAVLLICSNSCVFSSTSESISVLMPRLLGMPLPMIAAFRHDIYPHDPFRTYLDEWTVDYALWDDGLMVVYRPETFALTGSIVHPFGPVDTTGRYYSVRKIPHEQVQAFLSMLRQKQYFHRDGVQTSLRFPFGPTATAVSIRDPESSQSIMYALNEHVPTPMTPFGLGDIKADFLASFDSQKRERLKTLRLIKDLRHQLFVLAYAQTFKGPRPPLPLKFDPYAPPNPAYVRWDAPYSLTYQMEVFNADKLTTPPLGNSQPLVGVWLPASEMLSNVSALDSTMQAYRRCGINTVYIDTWYRGTVPYQSRLANASYEARYCVDLLRVLLSSAKARNLRSEAWTEFGFYAGLTSSTVLSKERYTSFGLKLKQDGLLARNVYGESTLSSPDATYTVLCPANPKNHKAIINLYLEIMQTNPWDGLQLDRIRFGNDRFCHCGYCAAAFEHDTGIQLTDAIVPGHSSWTAFSDWRRKQINSFVESLSKEMRSLYPQRTLSSSVCMPDMMDFYGQYWTDWLDKGWVDYVVPLCYSPESLAQLKKWIGSHPQYESRIVVGLGASDEPTWLLIDAPRLLLPNSYGISYWHWGILKDMAIRKLMTQNESDVSTSRNLELILNANFKNVLYGTLDLGYRVREAEAKTTTGIDLKSTTKRFDDELKINRETGVRFPDLELPYYELD